VLLGIAQVEKTRTKTSERKIVLNEMRINVEIRRGGSKATGHRGYKERDF